MTTTVAAVADETPLPEASREELVRRLHDPRLRIVDALAAQSYQYEHIPGAINVPVAQVDSLAPVLLPDRAAEIVVYCASFA